MSGPELLPIPNGAASECVSNKLASPNQAKDLNVTKIAPSTTSSKVDAINSKITTCQDLSAPAVTLQRSDTTSCCYTYMFKLDSSHHARKLAKLSAPSNHESKQRVHRDVMLAESGKKGVAVSNLHQEQLRVETTWQ